VVAVIDAGIAPNHPDLAPNLVFATCFAVAPGCDPYPSPASPGSHATRVAGVIAAAFGGGRAVGVGPGLGLASYKIYEPDGSIYFSSIWNALLDASERGFKVVNMSLAGWIDRAHTRGEASAFLTAMNRVLDEVTRRGTLIVVAAGNDWMSFNGEVEGILSLPQVVAASATGIRPQPAFPQEGAFDVLSYWSTWGAQVDIAAPGGDCGPGTWTVKDGPGCVQEYRLLLTAASVNPSCAAAHNCPTGYARGTGTSFAAPAVAAAAALVFDVNPALNPHQVKAILQRTAQPLGDRLLFGHGMLDVAAAVQEASR
jgi:subtilisin family serine protease